MPTAVHPQQAAASTSSGSPPTISVVIPCHAPSADLLGRAVAAWLAQRPSAEVILVDDGSPEALDSPAREVRVLRLEENRGAGAARNAGARRSTADVFVFADGDVEPLPSVLGAVRALLGDRRDADGLVGVPVMHPGDGDALTTYKMVYLDRMWRLAGREVGSANGSLVAVRRGAFDAAGGFPESRGAGIEDIELGARLLATGARLRICPEMGYVHHKSYRWGPTLVTTYRRALDFARRILIRSRVNSMGRPAQLATNLRAFWRFFGFYFASLAAFYVPLAVAVHAAIAGGAARWELLAAGGSLGLWVVTRAPLGRDLLAAGGVRTLATGLAFQVCETVLCSVAMLHATLTPWSDR